ncbi:MAG: PadR family transcriptional regulator [Anaerolineae bacterium]|nr:PadR family transcriptional regulator [Anaerolineae bacterium]MDW8299819.1 PadR family transcriptional regulator [Anaerolineae bacterium]
MSLLHAILGILNLTEASGYDLKTQMFDRSVAHFWQADQAQIYRTLEKLAEQGWVESRLEIQTERPNRKVYRITEAGRAELYRWLNEPQALPIHREPFLIQLFFGAQLPNQTLIALAKHQLALHEQKLAEYEQIPLPKLETQPDRAHTLMRLTLDLGIASEKLYIDWLKQVIGTLEHLPES